MSKEARKVHCVSKDICENYKTHCFGCCWNTNSPTWINNFIKKSETGND